MQFLWKYIDDMVGKGLEWHVIAELLMYTSVTLVPLALPLAILLASLMTFGNLGESYELFAIKSSGISLYRIMRPMAVLVMFISVGTFYFSNNLLPYTNLKMRTLLHDVQHQNPEVSIQEGIFTNSIEGFSIKVEKKDKKTNDLINILVYDHRDPKKAASIIIAERGHMRVTSDKNYMILKLENGHLYDEIDETKPRGHKRYPYQRTNFKEQTIYISMEGIGLHRSDEGLFKDNYQMLSLSQLDVAIDSLAYDIVRRKQVVGTNILKYSLFKGMRSYHWGKKSSLVSHTKTTTTTKNGKTEVIQENLKIPFSNGKPVKPQKEQDTLKAQKTPENQEIDNKSKIKKDDFTVRFPFPAYDTLNKETLTVIDLDSLYNSHSVLEQNRIIDVAQNYARSAQSYIYYSVRDFDGNRRWITRHEIEWHKKFVLSISCLLLFFIGAPLGAIIRKGGIGMSTVISVLFFIVYFIISMFSEKMVREAVLPPEIGMWISTAVLTPIGIFLTIKATNDSMNIRTETYDRFIQKIRILRKKKRKQRSKTA